MITIFEDLLDLFFNGKVSEYGWDLVYLFVSLPVVFFALSLAVRVGLLAQWQQEKKVEALCGQGIMLNLLVAVTLGIIVAF